MFPQPMSRSELRRDDSPLAPTRVLEEHILAGFPPDLALDLVLNELVVRAAEATRANSAALALARGTETELVCRAATGRLAPDLGVPINTRDGLSGACFQTRQPQLSVDTEFDPRIDPVVSRLLGIRSILIVPVFEANNRARFAGILEIFSASPAAFSHNDQVVLEGFAEECARIRQSALELAQRQVIPGGRQHRGPSPAELAAAASPEISPSGFEPPVFQAASPPLTKYQAYEAWTLVLGALALVAIISFSLLIGARIGWLRLASSQARLVEPVPASAVSADSAARARASAAKSPAKKSASLAPSKSAGPADELVIYEKGKVVFRMRPATAKPKGEEGPASGPGSTPSKGSAKSSVIEASSNTKMATARSVWLAPEQAETRLLGRTEPEYPAEALAAHRAGNVVLEVQVAEDGSVSSTRILSGDPILATAATAAVRQWRYQPYRRHDRTSPFQTDVTLTFTLPN